MSNRQFAFRVTRSSLRRERAPWPTRRPTGRAGGGPEPGVGAVQPVEHHELRAVVLVELEVVVVVELAGEEPGQVVPRVDGQGVDEDVRVPEPHRRHVAPQQQRPDGGGQQVGDHVLRRVRVRGGEGHGRRPLVVHLVNALIRDEGPFA